MSADAARLKARPPARLKPRAAGSDLWLRLVETKESARLRVERAMRAPAIPAWRLLKEGPVRLGALEAEFIDVLADVHFLLQHLWTNRAIVIGWPAGDPEVEIGPATSGEVLDVGACDPRSAWKLSRFAFMHADADGTLIVETGRVPVVTRILKPRVAAVLGALASPKNVADLQSELKWGRTPHDLEDLLSLFNAAGAIMRCDEEGQTEEDRRPELQQWEPHDLLFHMRSRQGRHEHPMGAGFRFRGRLTPQPATKPNPWAATAIRLPPCDLYAVAATEPPFTVVLEMRRSIRAHDFSRPITLLQLAEFLFRTSRIRYRFQTENGEFTSRPYPNGGASYELELYVTVNACAGLERGFYYYDPQAHSLSLVQRANEDTEGLLDDAWLSSARQCRPQVLITMASRFQRVSWKYSGMAYAAQLKNAGVLYQTFYLVATAMNLAGCGLGLGNSARFCRLAGTSYFEEGSIGEFMLGTPA